MKIKFNFDFVKEKLNVVKRIAKDDPEALVILLLCVATAIQGVEDILLCKQIGSTTKELDKLINWINNVNVPQESYHLKLTAKYFDVLSEELESVIPGITEKLVSAGNVVKDACLKEGMYIGTKPLIVP